MEANLLQALKTSNFGSVDDVVLYGRIRCMIESPKIFRLSTKDDVGGFAILDVFAIRSVGSFDPFQTRGCSNPYRTYNSKGSLIICIDKPHLVGKYVKVGGRNFDRGVKVKQQRGHKSANDGIVAFVWDKSPKGEWVVGYNCISELAASDSVFNASFLDYVIKHINLGTEIEEYPISSALDFEGLLDYVEVDSNSVKGIEGKFKSNETGERIDLSKIDLHLTNHLEGISMPDYFYDIKDDIEAMSKKRLSYARDLVSFAKSSFSDNSDIILSSAKTIRKNFIDGVVAHSSENVGQSKVKGKVYYESFISCWGLRSFDDTELSDKVIKRACEEASLDPYVLMDNDVLPFSDVVVASMIIGISTGIGYSGLVNNYKSVRRISSISINEWFGLLLTNPYALAMLGSSLTVYDADVIFYSFSKYFAATSIDSNKTKDLRYELIYLQVLEDLSKEDSIVLKSNLRRHNYKYKGSKYLDAQGFPLKKDLIELIKVICRANNISLSANEMGFINCDAWNNKKTLTSLIDNGIVNTIDDDSYIIETSLEKEMLIFEVFQKKGHLRTGITQEECDAICEEFEAKVGFQLTPDQRRGVGLTMYQSAVLSGCAGSGKTTTSDAMVMCIKRYLEDYKVLFCAPTGKAARRMAEVLGTLVKTVHSEFRVGVGVGESFLQRVDKVRRRDEDEGEEDEKIKAYFIDESGMLNRDLLYEVAKNISDEDIIFFLGDIKQLPPIGVGCPFYNLMHILPCVELGVSKRSAEGSNVNYNTTVINCCSDDVLEGLIFDKDTFIRTICSTENIVKNTLEMWKGFMDGSIDGIKHKEDDIQVISAYAKDTCLYSSKTLNPELQKYLRRNDKLLFRHINTDFYKNDRVIHVNMNLYGVQRFAKDDEGNFVELLPIGVVNGELGRVVGVFHSRSVNIVELDVDSVVAGEGFYENVTDIDDILDMIDLRDKYADRLDDIESYKDDDVYFVDVEVFDVSIRKFVHIFYSGRCHNQDGLTVLTGESLSNLELAYALTCHKMQGSQIPIALIPIGSDANPAFCNRNMLNTMITRSQGIVGMIGDVGDGESALNKGRMYKSKCKTDSVLSLLCDEASEG